MTIPKIDLKDIPVRILLINASPDKQDHTAGLIDCAREGVQSLENVETELYEFTGKEFLPCKGCVEYCLKHTKCVIKDAMAELAVSWTKADGIIWGIPLYAFGTASQPRSFIDRFGEMNFQAKWPDQKPWWRFSTPVGQIISGPSDHGGFDMEALGVMSHQILINAIHVPGDNLASDLGVLGRFDADETVADRPDLQEAARRLGVRVTEMAKFLSVGKLAVADALDEVYWCAKGDYTTAAKPA
jgi:multimeric flavodoxin WrbA